MNATEFARRRGRIEHQPGKSHSWRVRALRGLVNDARAILMHADGKVVGYQLPNGQTVCMKQRYRDEERALAYLAMITRCDGNTQKKPQRAYPCPICHGYHLTSQARQYKEPPNEVSPTTIQDNGQQTAGDQRHDEGRDHSS